MKKLFVLLAIVMLGLMACTPKQSNLEFVNEFASLQDRLLDAVELAENTSRGNLHGVIPELQSIEREASHLVYPDDLSVAGKLSCETMFVSATACFVEFLGGEDYPRACRSIAPQGKRCNSAMLEMLD